MSYCIVGGGPSGLSLAYVLATNNYKVTLIERDDKLGGSWKSDWEDGLYFSENSPRVLSMSPYMKRFFRQIGLNKEDYGYVYGRLPNMLLKFLLFFYKNGFNLKDILLFVRETIKSKFVKENITVKNWLDKTSFSKGFRKSLEIFCILMCDRTDKTNVQSFLHTLTGPGEKNALKQFREPNKWHTLILDQFKTMNNVTVLLNTEAKELHEYNSKIYQIKCEDREKTFSIDCDKVFLCTQSNNIIDIVKNSSDVIRNNWNSYDWLEQWSLNTYYIGFGFTINFTEDDVPMPYEWCWSCGSEWTVIILPVSNWLKVPSKDNNVKTVWSVCIVDMDTRSSYTGKTPNESTREEVIEECLRQINNIHKIPKPYKIVTNKRLIKKNGKWMSGKTGFTRNTLGYLPMKGKIDNLFALGSFTQTSDGIATFGRTIEATALYLNQYEKGLKGFHKPRLNIELIVIIIITLILVFRKR